MTLLNLPIDQDCAFENSACLNGAAGMDSLISKQVLLEDTVYSNFFLVDILLITCNISY